MRFRPARRDLLISRTLPTVGPPPSRANEHAFVVSAASSRRCTRLGRLRTPFTVTEAGRRLVEKAIAVQHSWIASTLGRMAEPALVALEAKLVALRNIVGEAETPQPGWRAEGVSEADAICEVRF